MTTTTLNGTQPTNGAAGLGALAEGIAYEARPADRDEGRRSRLTLITSAEFAGMDLKHEWLVEKVLVKGQPCILGGPRKALKTGILVDMAVSLAAPPPAEPEPEPAAEADPDDDDAGPGRPAGRPVARVPRFLGHFRVPRPARVGLFSGESGAATLRETALRICAARGTTLARSGVCWGFDLPRLADPRDVEHLARLIDDQGLEVVLLDPLYLMLAGGAAPIDAGNLFQVGPLLAEVTRACLEAGATLVLAHHARKNRPADERYEPLELEDLAYAGIQEFARQWLLVSRRERYDASGMHRLWLGAGGVGRLRRDLRPRRRGGGRRRGVRRPDLADARPAGRGGPPRGGPGGQSEGGRAGRGQACQAPRRDPRLPPGATPGRHEVGDLRRRRAQRAEGRAHRGGDAQGGRAGPVQGDEGQS